MPDMVGDSVDGGGVVVLVPAEVRNSLRHSPLVCPAYSALQQASCEPYVGERP